MTEIRDLLEIAQRVEQLRTAPPAPLHFRRERDGPGYPNPKPAPERRSGPQNSAPANPAGISYRSRKVLP